MADDIPDMLRYLLPDRRLRWYIFLLTAQLVIYTIVIHMAFPVLEGRELTLMESLFFVLETILTVGYGEQLPFSNQITYGIVTLIMATGVLTVLMIIPVILGPYITSLLKATPPRRVPHELEHHIVIVGFGELTRALIESLMIADLPIVIVEEDEERAREARRKYFREVHVMWGDYGIASTWTGSFVQNADYVIISEEERTTATIILGIREMTSARIISLVDDLSFDRYLRYAGAEYILSPKNSTGKILARHAVLRPEVDTIYEAISLDRMKIIGEGEDKALKLIKVPIMEGCRCTGKTLGNIDLFNRYGVDVLFFWKQGEFVLHPRDEDIIDTSTMLFLLGRANILSDVLEEEFASDSDGEDIAVIAGYGDVGRAAFHELDVSGINCIIVDPQEREGNVVTGPAEHEETLKETHIEEARFCIVAVNDDDVNIFTTLMARNMNPAIRILARANEPSSVDKLYRAGADYVALLPTIGGQVVAGIVLADIVQVLLDLPNEQKVVMKHIMRNVPTTVGWLEKKSGVRILGIEGADHSVIRPGSEEVLRQGDAVIAVGDIRTLRRFISYL